MDGLYLNIKNPVGHLHKREASGKQMSGLFGILLAQKMDDA